MQKIIKQMVFLSILLESRDKVALKTNKRTKDSEVVNKYLKEKKERQHG